MALESSSKGGMARCAGLETHPSLGFHASSRRLRARLLRSSALVSASLVALIAATTVPALADPSECTVTGTTTLVSCNATAAQVSITPGAGSLTVTDLTTQAVVYESPQTTGTYNQTVNITGNTVIDNPAYSGLVMQFGTNPSSQVIPVTVNADVTVGANVSITSFDGFGAVWVRNDYGGSIAINNAGTLSSSWTASTIDATLNGTSNLGPVNITNSGSVTSTNGRGIYADGNYRGATDGVREIVSVTNTATGVVNAESAGIRVINYYGLAQLTNEGTVNATLRQGLVAWSADGDSLITNSGSVTSGNDNAVYAMTEIGKATIVNSGTVTAQGDPTLDAAHTALATIQGMNGLRAGAYTSGDVQITNEATGVVISNRDAGIRAETPQGDVTIINYGSVTGLYGIVVNSGFGTNQTAATVPTIDGLALVGNAGTVNTTGLAVDIDATTNWLANLGTLATTGAVAVQTGNGDSIVGNLGTISAGSATGTAISMGSGNNRLIMFDTSTIIGKVVNASSNNTLELEGSASGTLDLASVSADGAFQGFSTLVKSGTGTWSLIGSGGSLTGTFTVDAGTLQIGNGGTSGAIANDVAVAAGAALAFNRSDDITYANVISGAGSLIKNGAGTLILTGENTYTGGTLINAGTLQIGNGGTTGSVVGDIVNNAALIFNRSGSYDFPGTISGSGSVTILGGTVNFTGANAFNGPIDVEGSDFILSPGAVSSSPFTIGQGGTIGGTGTIGGLIVQNGGTASPGYSPGTLAVNGNVSFAAGSTYVVDVTSTAHDLIVASGTATLSGGVVQVVADGSYTSPLSTFAILTADGGVTGTFASVSANYAFLTPVLSYDPNNVYLTLARNDVTFASTAVTPNQFATATAVQSLPLGNAVYNSVLQLGASEAPYAFNQLSGEIHASAQSVFMEQSSLIRGALNDRLRAAQGGVGASAGTVVNVVETSSGALAYAAPSKVQVAADMSMPLKATPAIAPVERFSLWTTGFGNWGSFDGTGNAAGINDSTGGFLIGADTLVGEGWRLGVAGGYSYSDLSSAGRNASGSSDNWHVGLYGGNSWGALALRTGLSYTWQDVSTSRSVVFPGFADGLSADYDTGTFQAFGELGWRIETVFASFEPFANLAYVSLDTSGYFEQGGAAALYSDGADMDTTFTTLGLRVSREVMLGTYAATLRGEVGWRHAFGDITPSITQAFLTSEAFTVTGVPIAEDAAVLEAGLDVRVGEATTIGIAYAGQFGGGVTQNGFNATLSVRF
ncbi:autotransporter domain-containing protein [Ancylobacter sp. VNQ12]